MLPNPFTPSRIANKPQDFFGRDVELSEIPRVIRQGSIVIDGPVGIGKSSLLSQIALHLEEPSRQGKQMATVYPIVCDSSLKSPEDVAARILSEIADPREQTKKKKFILPKLFEYEVSTVDKKGDPARALRVICDLLTAAAREHERLVVVALDEADKCAPAVAQFVRVILTRTELDQSGLDRIRFLMSGVSPFYSTMIETDAGIARFVYQRYSLPPFPLSDAVDFLAEKFDAVLKSREAVRRGLDCDDSLFELVARVTGGHPHLLQLVGSYIIDHEDADPDNRLDAKDLVGCFQRICYQSRGPVYEHVLHNVALDGHLASLKDLLSIATGKCPTVIELKKASDAIEDDALKYFVQKGHFSFDGGSTYRLNDEFLRIRMLLDEPETNRQDLERRLLTGVEYFENRIADDHLEGDDFNEDDSEDD